MHPRLSLCIGCILSLPLHARKPAPVALLHCRLQRHQRGHHQRRPECRRARTRSVTSSARARERHLEQIVDRGFRAVRALAECRGHDTAHALPACAAVALCEQRLRIGREFWESGWGRVLSAHVPGLAAAAAVASRARFMAE